MLYLLFTFFDGCAVGWSTSFKALESFQPFVFHASGRRGRHFTFAVGVGGALDFGSKEFFLQIKSKPVYVEERNQRQIFKFQRWQLTNFGDSVFNISYSDVRRIFILVQRCHNAELWIT